METRHRCPICREPAAPTPDNKHRPFCSERCQMLDLGRWMQGDYAIPGEPVEIAERQPEDEK